MCIYILLLLLFFTRKRGREDSINLLGWWCHVAVSPCRRVVPWVACGMLPCTIRKSSIIKHHVITTPPWKTEIREIGVFWRWWCWHDWAGQPFLGGTSMNIIEHEWTMNSWGKIRPQMGQFIFRQYIYIYSIYMVWYTVYIWYGYIVRSFCRSNWRSEKYIVGEEWMRVSASGSNSPGESPIPHMITSLGYVRSGISMCRGEKSLEVSVNSRCFRLEALHISCLPGISCLKRSKR